MNPTFERFIKKVIQETDCSREEREDLLEELVAHLESACDDLKKDGHTDEEATQLAMINFGDGKNVGKTLQHAMYPYRREMLLALGIGSLLMTYGIYLSQLFVMGDAHIGWLLLGVLTSSCLLFLTLRPIVSMNRRAVMNSLLVVHLLVMGAGLLLSLNLDPPYSMVFSIIDPLIVVFTIILIFRTTIYDVPATELNLKTGTKLIHYFNLFMGILLIAGTLFFLYGYLMFASEWYGGLWKLFVPIALWGVLYAVQLTLLNRQWKKSAYFVSVLQLSMPFILYILWLTTVRAGVS